MRFWELNEVRRNPELNPKINYIDGLKEIAKKYKNAFVTFTYNNKIGINPQADYDPMPLGIYAYPIQYIIEKNGVFPWPRNPNYAKVFVPHGNILYLSTLTRELANEYADKIKNLPNFTDDQIEKVNAETRIYKQKIGVWDVPALYFINTLYALSSNTKDSRNICIKIGLDGIVNDTYSKHVTHPQAEVEAVFFHVSKLTEIETFYLKENKVLSLTEIFERWEYINDRFEYSNIAKRDHQLEKSMLYHLKRGEGMTTHLNNNLFSIILSYINLVSPAFLNYGYGLKPYILKSKDPHTIVEYTYNVLNYRWPEAEKYIKKNHNEWEEYKEYFGIEE